MTNTYAATLAILPTPDIDYALDEASGSFENSGGGGALDLSDILGSPQYQAPGIIRNAPFEYGTWTQPQAGNKVASAATGGAGSPAVVGWTTGTFSVFCMRFGSYDGDDFYPFTLSYRSGAAITTTNVGGFVIDENGRLFFVIGSSVTSSIGTNGFRWASTSNNVVPDGVPVHLACVQRGDSTGLHVFVNGVEVAGTLSVGTALSNNTFMDKFDVVNTELTGPFVINGAPTGTTANFSVTNTGHAVVQRPTVWRNVALSDVQIQALHASANLQAIPQDIYEYLFDRFCNVGGSREIVRALYMHFGWLGGTGDLTTMEAGFPTTSGDTNNRMDWGGTKLALNTLDTTLVQTEYPSYYTTAEDGAGQYSAIADLIDNQVRGTWSILFNLTATLGTNDSDRRAVLSYGEGTAGDDENIVIHFGGTSFGTTIILTVGRVNTTGTTTGDFYRRVYLPGDTGLGLATPHFALVTLTQDGTGFKLYVNGVEITTFSESSIGTTYDANSWTNDLVTPSSPRFAANFPSTGSMIDGLQIFQLLALQDTALTAAQVLEYWNAINGIFPPGENPPPLGGFNDTLTNTGNDADPNGPGPNHYWRLNAESLQILDIGINTVNGNSIAQGGDPLFSVQGPLIDDPSNAAIYFDGAGDYFEIGRDLATGRLVTDAIGTIGFFVSLNDFTTENLAYSQADATGAQRISMGVNNGKPELFVQTSAGNSVRYTAENELASRDFFFVVITNDGTDYRLYIDCVLDANAVQAIEGTGAAGDWFDTVGSATRSAVAALATSGFITETTARFSELFIYSEVLTETQICALFDAAVNDGINTSANALGVLQFEDVRFLNGGLADVRAINPRTDFNQAVIVDGCQFEGGAQGAAVQSLLLSGETRAQIRGSTFNLNDTPVAGRAAVHATVADPTAAATTFGSLEVINNTFDRMGRAADPVVYLEAGFGATIAKNRFFNSLASAIGWRGDARRVNVRQNLIDTVTAGLAGIHVRAGLNTQIGTAWNVERNTILDVALGDGILIEGANSSAAEFARNIRVANNLINTVAGEYINLHQIQDALIDKNQCADGAVDGILLRSIAGVVTVRQNSVQNHSGEGIRTDEGSLQTVSLVIDRNVVNGVAAADGIQVNNVTSLILTSNDLVNLVNGLTLGTIGTRAKVRGNNLNTVTTPLVLSGTQAGLDFGDNSVANLAALQALTVAAEAVNVSGPYHTITAGSATDLTAIGGPNRAGQVLVLLLAAGSSQITLVDGANLVLAGNFVMGDAGLDNIWLVNDGTNWNELDRRSTA